ncbi:hypothetical protein AB4254_08955 [Vibrio breoganii]
MSRFVTILILLAVFSAKSVAAIKELQFTRNKMLLSSIALSISHFEGKTGGSYNDIIIYTQRYNNSLGMLNYSSESGSRRVVNGLIVVYLDNVNAYVYFNGRFAYSVELHEEFKLDLESRNIGTQLYAIANYKGVSVTP